MYDSFRFWNYIRDIEDQLVMDIGLRLTDVDEEVLNGWLKEEGINYLKEEVAYSVLREFRGDDAEQFVRAKNSHSKDVFDLKIEKAELLNGIRVFDVLSRVIKGDLSSSQIKNIIRSGGLTINQERVKEVDCPLSKCVSDDRVVIDFGKSRKYIILLVD